MGPFPPVPPYDLDPARRRAPPQERSPLWRLNTAAARPIARFFAMLGVAPGQLSLQSLTLTIVGLVRLASGEWSHVVQGALIVYGGLLLDRADWVLAQELGRPRAWGTFLGLFVDRVVEAGLVVALCMLLLVGLDGVPAGLPDAWSLVSTRGALVVGATTLAAMFLWRLVASYTEVLSLRSHLLSTRRLPGPSLIVRRPQGVERLNRWFDRDLLIVAWLVGAVLGQVQLTLVVLLAAHGAAVLESVALFWHRSKDPEPTASRVLAADYP